MIRFFLKLMFFPILIPLYMMWAIFGRMLGGRHKVYDVWRW